MTKKIIKKRKGSKAERQRKTEGDSKEGRKEGSKEGGKGKGGREEERKEGKKEGGRGRGRKEKRHGDRKSPSFGSSLWDLCQDSPSENGQLGFQPQRS